MEQGYDSLGKLISTMKESRQPGSQTNIVNAIGLRTEILEKVMAKGQELKIIGEYEPKQSTDEYDNMSIDELEKQLNIEHTELEAIRQASMESRDDKLTAITNVDELEEILTEDELEKRQEALSSAENSLLDILESV